MKTIPKLFIILSSGNIIILHLVYCIYFAFMVVHWVQGSKGVGLGTLAPKAIVYSPSTLFIVLYLILE